MHWLSRCVLGAVVVLPAALFAVAPPAINYQGRVLAPDGSPAPGPVDLTLRIWDSATMGTQLYAEQHRGTALTDGIFDVLLGAGSDRVGTLDADTFVMAERWLELSINGEALAPRQPFSSVPYAFQAQRAERATTADKIGSLAAADVVPRSGGTFTGVVGFNGPNGKSNILLSHLTSNPDHGFLSVQSADGTSRADIFVNAQSEGIMRVANATGQFSVALTAGNNGGLASVSNTAGKSVALMSSASNGNGLISASDPEGTIGSLMGNGSSGGIISVGRGSTLGAVLGTDANGGSLVVLDKNGNEKVGMEITATNQGRIFANVKNFIVDHPTRPGVQIVYASLEGPEAAIYHRGTVALSNGRAIITLPEHFAVMAASGTLTVQLTPESLDSQGLGFRRIDDGHLEVGELHAGQGSYPVHFVVHAVRRGYEDYQPVVGSDAALGAGGAARRPGDGAAPVRRAMIAEAARAAQEAAALQQPAR